jgi:hypothetical protein
MGVEVREVVVQLLCDQAVLQHGHLLLQGRNIYCCTRRPLHTTLAATPVLLHRAVCLLLLLLLLSVCSQPVVLAGALLLVVLRFM